MNIWAQLTTRITMCVVPAVFLLAGCAKGPIYDSAPRTPVNISPVEGSDLVINAQTTFVWRASEDTAFYDFHLFNNENGDIEQYARRNINAESICQDGQCSLTLGVALPFLADHAWRVRSGNDAGRSAWTRTRFNMIGSGSGAGLGTPSSLATPGIPTPVSPESTAVESSTLVEFVWRSIPDATGYDFHIFDAVNAEMVDTLNDLPATTVCQGSDLCRITRTVRLLPSEAHAWRIRAVNQHGRSAWTRSEFNVVR